MENLYNMNIELQSSLVLKQSKILYVESDDKLFSTMKALFDYAFEESFATTNTKDGFEVYEKNKDDIDVILIDMHIEDFSSIEFVKKIREVNDDVIIVISVLPFNEGAVEDYIERSNNFYELIKMRINDLLQKPYQPMTTLKVLSKHLIIKENARIVGDQKSALFYLKYIVDHQNLLSETDLDGNITYVNDKFCQISGYSKSELIGHSHNIIRHPDMDDNVFKDLWKKIKAGEVWEGRVKNRKKDGGYYWVDAIIAPIKENGEIVKYMASRQDITELVDKEKLMRNEIKRIKSENYRDREVISQQAYDEGISRYVKEFDSLKIKINSLQSQLQKEESKNRSSMTQIDTLIKSEKEAKVNKDKILSKAKKDLAELFDKNKKLEKDKHNLEKKLEDAVLRYENLQNSLKST